MKSRIHSVRAREILDSRGSPTVAVEVTLADGSNATSAVPSGVSTGEHEAVELRDGDLRRYGGKGVRKAVANVNEIIAPKLSGLDPTEQKHLPVPTMNVVNGGKHADSSLDFQEFMIVPRGAPSFGEALRYGAETFEALKTLLKDKGQSTAVGDEGGFAPHRSSNEEACELIMSAIERAGYRPGEDISIALDPAASSFFEDGKYLLSRSGQREKTAGEMIALYGEWRKRYPIVSIEDGLAENDWTG